MITEQKIVKPAGILGLDFDLKKKELNMLRRTMAGKIAWNLLITVTSVVKCAISNCCHL